ncbi:MAG: chorismate-binding protein, partial [Synergistaceae bacterium]|nr:chorismate-binding protein [Synergistaceae bacterium]
MSITVEQAKKFAKENYSVIPLSREIFSDIKTPVEVMRILMELSEHCFILESAGDNENWGRYTFLGYDPKLCVSCKDENVKISYFTDKKEQFFRSENPDFYIRQIIAENKSPAIKGMPPFTGGLVGYFAYDYLKYSEHILKNNVNDLEKFNDVDLMLFDKVIAFDNFRQKIVLIVNIDLKKDINSGFQNAQEELNKIEALIRRGKPQKEFSCKLKSDFQTLFNKEIYCDMVKRAKEHIIDGDIFQIVLSNRMEADFEGSLFNTYRVLRTLNPSPYMFYFS